MRVLGSASTALIFLCLCGEASATTLSCKDSTNPAYEMTVEFNSTKVITPSNDSSYVSKNEIFYKKTIDSSEYETIIYRSTGKFTVFVKEKDSGKFQFSFYGYCQPKTANKF